MACGAFDVSALRRTCHRRRRASEGKQFLHGGVREGWGWGFIAAAHGLPVVQDRRANGPDHLFWSTSTGCSLLTVGAFATHLVALSKQRSRQTSLRSRLPITASMVELGTSY
jgi:hypothetical protein